jgi:hypothetical protein
LIDRLELKQRLASSAAHVPLLKRWDVPAGQFLTDEFLHFAFPRLGV